MDEETEYCEECGEEVEEDRNPPTLCDDCAWNIFNEEGPEGLNDY